jgi:hypothetical protein
MVGEKANISAGEEQEGEPVKLKKIYACQHRMTIKYLLKKRRE